MRKLNSKTLFFTTSPRSPLKMIPEIKILKDSFEGEKWNSKNQIAFIQKLSDSKDFEGTGSLKDLAFSARDRINRAPKALGFVDLNPTINITAAGEKLINGKRTEEVLLRQLLKFQLPSPYHIETDRKKNSFKVKPYLEIFRLIYTLGTISFDELLIFGMQLTDYNKFDQIVEDIKSFRRLKTTSKMKYKVFKNAFLTNEITNIYEDEIKNENFKIRESFETSLNKFVKTKANNMRDYADACFRYLRATGLVEISQRGHSLSIMTEKIKEVEYFLKTLDREPVYINNETQYKAYLFNTNLPHLYTDEKENIIFQLEQLSAKKSDYSNSNIEELKDTLETMLQKNKQNLLAQQIQELKDYKHYNDVLTLFEDIKNNVLFDAPLMLEWNVWRAMTMIDGGNIKGNLKIDDKGEPMSTAIGNIADIICDYDDFNLAVEVTMSSGQKQYEMEGEPVSRHLAKLKKETNKDAYCLFIAPKINPSIIAHFYALHKIDIEYYGGKSVIVPVELDIFINMLEQSYRVDYIPNKNQIKSIFEYSVECANSSANEKDWYASIKDRLLNWL